MTKILKKILVIALLVIMLLNTCSNIIYAAVEINISKVFLEKIGEADYHLKYYREDDDEYRYLKCSIVGYYDKDGNFNPSYCMNKDLVGAEDNPYNVTVDSLLDNNKVWRVIKNGYPYKSAKKLGLSSEYNAYAVTKWAVYCVLGESKLDYYKADKDDKEAVAMLKVLKNLVEIGLEGTEKQDDNPLKITKVNEFKEDGEYYSQEYKVTSTSEFNTYKISDTDGLPKGSFIANTKGEKQKTFNSEDNFKIMIDKDHLDEDIDVEVEISAECKAYVILEGKTTVTNTQNYVVTAGEYAKFTKKVYLKKETNTGKIKVNKVDSETNKPIQGVEFELRDSKGKTVSKATTDANGIATFNGLYQGKYILVETKPNKDYIITQAEFDVEVKYDEITQTTIKNEPKKGQVKVIKVDKDNNEIKLEKVNFKVMNEKGDILEEIVTDKNGEAITSKYSIRDYKTLYIQEVETKEEYKLNNEKILVELKAEEVTTIKIENEIKKGKIKIVKVDKDNNQIKLKGVEFNIYNEKNELVETVTTNSVGEAISKDLPITSKYTVKETKTNEQYVLNDETIKIEVKDNKVTETEIENEHKKGNLKIYKVDEDNPEIGLGNIEFELYSEEFKKVIGTYATNADGEIYIENLRTGTYKLKELTTNKWYNLINDLRIEVEWEEEKPVTEIIVKNELKKGQVKVVKTDKDDNEIKLEGVKFNVMNEKGEILEEIVTDSKGEAITSKYSIRDYKKLCIQEKEAKEGYRLNDEIIKVQLKENEVTTIKLENEVKKGKIKVVKVDKDNNEIKLEDVEFEIYDNKEDLVDTLITDKNGEAISKDLPITSKYTIKETKTLNNYVITDKVIEVELKDSEAKEVIIENEKIKSQIKIIKVDKENHEIKLENVKFDILDSKGEIVDKIKTDIEGVAITRELPINEKYTIKETETNNNYILSDKTIDVELKDDEILEIKVENEKKKGKIKVIKVDKENHEIKLENVEFDILDGKGEIVDKIKTDKNGEAITKDLPISNNYIIKETKTNKYYKLNEELITVEVNYNETTEIEIENELKKSKIKIEKVDKDNNDIKLEGVEFDILNTKGEVVDKIKTDKEGVAISKELSINEKYTIKETKTLDNYVLNDKDITVEFKDDKVQEIKIENKKIKGIIKVTKTSQDDNPITGEKAGTPLEGIQFDIYNINNNKIQTITTNKQGIAESKELEKGLYFIKEIYTRPEYILNDKIFQAEIIEDGQTEYISITNESRKPNIDIEKTGVDKAEVGTEIEYDISVRNTGNTSLDNFIWEDIIPADYIKVTKFETGTYNQDLTYDFYYKTNLSDDKYILLMEDLSTIENYEIDFLTELADNEYIIELKLDFGTVDEGFGSNDNPHIFAQIKEDVKSNAIFENVAKVTGEYYGYKVTDNSRWKTKTFKVLPKTGF